MTKMNEKTSTTPRRDVWTEIERRIFGQCIWQHVSQNRRCTLEGLVHKATGRIMIVEKTFCDPMPRRGERPFPELSSVMVYDQVAPDITGWDEYERALAALS